MLVFAAPSSANWMPLRSTRPNAGAPTGPLAANELEYPTVVGSGALAELHGVPGR
jgi:hypothetical protein